MRENADPRASVTSPPKDDDGEGGSAATELLVLLPVYLALIVITLTMGQFVLIRQKVAMSAQLQAWTANPQDVTGSVFQNYQTYGSYSSSIVDPPYPIQLDPQAQQFGAQPRDFIVGTNDLTVSSTEWNKRINNEPAPSGQTATSSQQLAQMVMLDGDFENSKVVIHPHLEWRAVHASFAYLPAFMPAMLGRDTAINPGCTCVTLGRKPNVERKVYRQGGGKSYYVSDRNPIEDVPDSWAFAISHNPSNGNAANGDNTDYRFLPPEMPVAAFNEKTLTPAVVDNGSDPGIWNTKFRIGGTEQTEWDFFKGQILGL